MQQLIKTLQELHIPYTDKQMEQFRGYRTAILEWNEKVNLTAIKDPDEFERKHFCDSVVIGSSEEFSKAQRIIDVGTGAGFPGVPLAVLYPDKEFVLMDSLAKRLKIVDEICKNLGILNVMVCHARAEDLGHNPDFREQYDICVSRAVASLPVLSEYCLPLVKTGGYFAPYKTGASEEELILAKKAMAILGGRYVRTQMAPDVMEEDHRIFWIYKENKTPAKYPRKAGTPSENPL